jgi:hypothetical protein
MPAQWTRLHIKRAMMAPNSFSPGVRDDDFLSLSHITWIYPSKSWMILLGSINHLGRFPKSLLAEDKDQHH